MAQRSLCSVTVAAIVAVLSTWVHPTRAVSQPVTTAFTFQGELASSGSPLTGLYDLRFRLFDAASGGTAVGPPLCSNDVNVVNGKVSISLDFGQQFFGQTRYLDIEVRPGAGLGCASGTGFTPLAPRIELTGAPNAIYSQLSGLASNTAQLNGQPAAYYTNAANLTGPIPPSSISGSYPSSVSLLNAGNQFAGTFVGNGSALIQLNASSISSGLLAPSRGGTGANTAGATNGSVLKWNGSAWAPDTDLNFVPTVGAGLALSGNTLSIPASGVTSSMLSPNAVTSATVLDGSLSMNDLEVEIGFFNYMSSNTMYTVQGRYVFGPTANVDPIPDYTLVVKGTAKVELDLFVDGAITTSAQVRTKAISPIAFMTTANTTGYFKSSNGMYGTDVGFTIQLNAQLDLPDGATINSVTFWYSDTSNTDLSFGMGRQSFAIGGAFSCGPDVASSGNAAGARSVVFLPTSNQSVDHATGVHSLTASWQVPATPNTMQLEGAVVTYTTNGAIP
jgi:hypothetical protein